MDTKTRVTNVKLKTSRPPQTSAVLTELPKPPGFWKSLFQMDRLARNIAVAGALLLTVLAVKNARTPESQSVFSALRDSVQMEWDESLGKLSFVSSLLPDEVSAVWSERSALTVMAPMVGQTVHAWTEQEPYLELLGNVSDVRAVADGEVMSLAHGMNEERIARVRHDDGNESIYGNLETCYADVGDRVYQGDVFARVPSGEPLAFELRLDGRSVNPEGVMEALMD